MTNKIQEDLEAMASTTPSNEEMGGYLCFVSEEFDRDWYYIVFSQNFRIFPTDERSGVWSGFCEYAERKYGYRKPSEEEFARLDAMDKMEKELSSDKSRYQGCFQDNSRERKRIAYALREKK